jgi:hypothetical protein
MFIQTWNKYLPVIRILLKRSVNATQTLDMDKSDFQRAAGGKKVKFVFSIMLVNGRSLVAEKASPLAKDLVTVLQQDMVANEFLRRNELEFTMNNNFQLVMTNNTPAVESPVNDAPASGDIKPGESVTE